MLIQTAFAVILATLTTTVEQPLFKAVAFNGLGEIAAVTGTDERATELHARTVCNRQFIYPCTQSYITPYSWFIVVMTCDDGVIIQSFGARSQFSMEYTATKVRGIIKRVGISVEYCSVTKEF